MLGDSSYSTSHCTVEVHIAVNLETNKQIISKLISVIYVLFYVDLIEFFVLNFTFKFINQVFSSILLYLFVVTSLCWNSLIVKSIVLLGFFFTFE
jgi:hypothetical protein